MQPNPREAITGFVAWLTTRTKVIKMGSSCECYDAMEAIKEYCYINNFAEVRDEHWPDIVTMPQEDSSFKVE
jgi:hypothetical protein